MKKSDYLKALADHRQVDDGANGDDAITSGPAVVERAGAPTVESAAPPAEQPAAAPAPQSAASEGAAAPTLAPQVAAPAPAAPPAEPELFKGESLLDPEVRKQIREQFESAKKASTLEAEQQRAREEYNRLHGKLAPTQQQLAQMQVANTQLQQELNKLKAKSGDAQSAALRQRIEAMKAQFPEDAQMWEGVLNGVESANQQSSELREMLQKQQQQQFINDQKAELSRAHPNWQSMQARVAQGTDGSFAVQPVIDTPDAREFSVWANALDPYERNTLWPLLNSARASDAIYLLNRFEHDRNLARQHSNAAAPVQQQQQQVPSASPAVAALAPDPDPSRRTTAPSTTPAVSSGPRPGQPVSDKHAEFLKGAAYWKELQEQRSKRSSIARRAN